MPSDKIKTIELNIEKKLIDKIEVLEQQNKTMFNLILDLYVNDFKDNIDKIFTKAIMKNIIESIKGKPIDEVLKDE